VFALKKYRRKRSVEKREGKMKKGRMVQIEYMQIYFKRTKERKVSPA